MSNTTGHAKGKKEGASRTGDGSPDASRHAPPAQEGRGGRPLFWIWPRSNADAIARSSRKTARNIWTSMRR
eukprot:8907521-Pyramimonas_sp.AAC.1